MSSEDKALEDLRTDVPQITSFLRVLAEAVPNPVPADLIAMLDAASGGEAALLVLAAALKRAAPAQVLHARR